MEAYLPEKCYGKRQNRYHYHCREIKVIDGEKRNLIEKPHRQVKKYNHDEKRPRPVVAFIHLQRAYDTPFFHHHDDDYRNEASH